MAEPDAPVIALGSFADRSASELWRRLTTARSQAAAARERTAMLLQDVRGALAENQAIRQAINQAIGGRESGPAPPERLNGSAHARMAARLQTMPVIEQAKGIIMERSRCDDAEAFDILRGVSQRSNIPVRDLAGQIVAKAAGQANGSL